LGAISYINYNVILNKSTLFSESILFFHKARSPQTPDLDLPAPTNRENPKHRIWIFLLLQIERTMNQLPSSRLAIVTNHSWYREARRKTHMDTVEVGKELVGREVGMKWKTLVCLLSHGLLQIWSHCVVSSGTDDDGGGGDVEPRASSPRELATMARTSTDDDEDNDARGRASPRALPTTVQSESPMFGVGN
jgi:hypothetical protein